MLDAGLESVSPADWMALGYLILFATAIAQQAWLFGVKGIGPSRASVLGNLTPVAAVVLSAVILKESVGTSEILGIVLILEEFGWWIGKRPGSQSRRLLKTSLFSPAQPWRAETRLFPCFVLALKASST